MTAPPRAPHPVTRAIPCPVATRGGAVLVAALAAALTTAPTPASAQTAPDDPPVEPRWIFAVEDTAEIPAFFEMSTVRTQAERLEIGDIVQRCIDREEELRGEIASHEYTALTQSVMYVGGRDEGAQRRLVTEQVERHFFRREDKAEESIPLKFDQYELVDGQRQEWSPEDEEGAVQIHYRDFDQLPFYLEDREDYDFDILSRKIVGDRVIYEVRLTPKSDFEIAPTGRIWVDTSNWQILREEFDFEDRVPMPMFIKRVGPFVRERERVGDLWVWKRLLIRVDLRLGYLRFLNDELPDRVEFAVEFRDHVVNESWSIDEEGVPR